MLVVIYKCRKVDLMLSAIMLNVVMLIVVAPTMDLFLLGRLNFYFWQLQLQNLKEFHQNLVKKISFDVPKNLSLRND